ncbi:MAG: gas vesicle protein [Pseudomonadota bacterium]
MSLDIQSPIGGDSLADVLERILDKGVVIAGDVSISLVGIELLTIRLRLLIATVDKAKELGINWWESDPRLVSPQPGDASETEALSARVAELEAQLAARPPAPKTRRKA